MNVPQGKETFRMVLDKELKRGSGKIHLAETGFQNPRWATAFLSVLDENVIEIAWFYQVTI